MHQSPPLRSLISQHWLKLMMEYLHHRSEQTLQIGGPLPHFPKDVKHLPTHNCASVVLCIHSNTYCVGHTT